jgi:DNA transposition AAA+ family ATPase
LAICEELRQNPRLLIFDEANRIRQSHYLDMLRYVHDVAGARIAFISFPSLQYVFGLHPEFGSRLQLRYQMKPLTATEVAAVLPGFPPEAVEAIHTASGGRPRSVMVISELLKNVDRKEWTADTVRRIARRFTMARAAA